MSPVIHLPFRRAPGRAASALYRSAIGGALIRAAVPGSAAESTLAPPVEPAPDAGAGTLGARPALSPKRVALGAARAVALFHAWYVGSTMLIIACFSSVDPAATTLALYRKYVDRWEIATPVAVGLREVPLVMRRMIVSAEDGKFWKHRGVDLEAVVRAYRVNQAAGEIRYGASTLTMQTARTLFLLPTRSYLRKYLEVIVALEMELILSKERIFELYLSWAEWGKGVFGVEAAATRYYKTRADKLTPAQAARLVTVLPSPILNTPATAMKNPRLAARYRFIAERYLR